MIGIKKEMVLKDFEEVLSESLSDTGDYVLDNYVLSVSENLYYTLKEWCLSDNLTHFKGVSIVMTTTETDYFYLKYVPQNCKIITTFIPKRFQAA